MRDLINRMKVHPASVTDTDKIVGCEQMKRRVNDGLLFQRLRHLARFDHLRDRLDGKKSILLHGPSGIGKTRLCLSFAKQCTMYSVHPSLVVEICVEDTGRNVRVLFAVA